MKKILLTAFEPFGGETINPSMEALKRLNHNSAQLIKCYLPTTYDHIFDLVSKHIKSDEPDFILMIGQAGGRGGISLERFALNLDDADLPDNHGVTKQGEVIHPDGKDLYRSNLPLKRISLHLQNKGFSTRISNHAGTYVCNHIFYLVLHEIETQQLNIKAGFIHVPYAHEQVVDKTDVFSMSIDEIKCAIEEIITVLTL